MMKFSAALLLMFVCSALLMNNANADGWGFGSGGFGSGSDCSCTTYCDPPCKSVGQRYSNGGNQECICTCQCPGDTQNPSPQLPPQTGKQPQQPPFQIPNPVPRQPPQRGNQPPVQNRPPYNGPPQVRNQPPGQNLNPIYACIRAQAAYGQCMSLVPRVFYDPNSYATHNAVRQYCCRPVVDYATYCVGNPAMANILAMPINLNFYCN